MAEKDRIRTEQFRFYLLPEEAAMLEKNAYEYGMSRADYLRKMILFGSVVGQHPVIDKEQGEKIRYETNKIGTNINQIAYNTNVNKEADIKEWKQIRNQFFTLLELVSSLLDLEEKEWDHWRQKYYNFMYESVGEVCDPISIDDEQILLQENENEEVK